jgi:hypothetical protein
MLWGMPVYLYSLASSTPWVPYCAQDAGSYRKGTGVHRPHRGVRGEQAHEHEPHGAEGALHQVERVRVPRPKGRQQGLTLVLVRAQLEQPQYTCMIYVRSYGG